MATKGSKIWKTILLWALLILAIILLSRMRLSVPLYDYVNYWSAGRLNLQGNNPYDLDQLLFQQQQVGWTEEWVLPTWYPPWALSILMPFSLFSYTPSRFLWFLASVSILVFAIVQSWKIYEGPPRQMWLGLFIGVLFTPTLIALMLGQASPWILLGVMGFLVYIKKSRSLWLAGIFAGLISIKPQLLSLFWIALVLWSLKQRKWQVLAGSGVSIVIGLAIASIFNPAVLIEYIQSILSSPPFFLATPTIGFFLRTFLGYEKSFLQFVPTLLGVVWLIFYWGKKHSTWDWQQEMPILIFVSIITAPYTWSHDQLILTPALMQATILLLHFRNHLKTMFLLAIFLCVNITNLLIHKLLDETWVIWMAPVLLVCYLIARQSKQESHPLQEGSS